MKKHTVPAKLWSWLLALVMILSLVPIASLTAYAADEVSENISLVNGQSLVLGTHYSVSGEFENESGIHVYNKGPMTINARKGETITKVVLTYSWGNNKSSLSASAGTFDGNATISGINAQQVTISSSNTAGVKISAVTVYFEGSLSNPTVTLTGGANAKSSGGLLTQSYLPGAMDTVTYTALTGAAFPEFETYTQNGVTVERTSDTVVAVSGTPTANTEITVPDAESSSKIVTWGSSIINDSGRNGIGYQIRRNNSYSDTANGITLTKSGDGNVGSDDWYSYGSLELNFTTATGKFTSIEIETSQIYDSGNWTKDGNTLKWNGTPSNSVSLSGSRLYLEGVSSINFVIEMPTVSVTVTPGSNMTKTAGSGAASQTGLSGAMTDVVYTADDGYYFPTDYSVAAVNGISVTRDSYTQITVSGTPTADTAIALTAPMAKTTPDAPTAAAATDCTTADNNDGKLTGVTAAMEYKKSDAADWTVGTGSDITGLVPGTYYVRVKATETTNASGNQELTIKRFISYTVTFKVVNGKWNEGEGDAATADKTVTLTGHDGDTLKLAANQIPAVGSKPNDTYKAGSWDTTPSADTAITGATTYTYTYAQKDTISQTVTFKVINGKWDDDTTADKTVTLTGYEGDTLKLAANQIPAVGSKPNDTYKAGSWDVTPNTDTAITEATTYTYTYVAKEASVVTKAPEAKILTYNGQAQELVTAGTATGGEMQYALGDANGATQPYTTSIPEETEAGTYYVWYKVAGDENHNDTNPACVEVTINKATPTYTAPIGLTATYGDTLSGVTLPTGWAWVDSTQSVGNVGTNTFKANFTPADTANYNTVSGVDVTVTVGKAAGKAAVISTDTMSYSDDSIYIEGVAGQEYIIVPKGTAVTDADWNTSVKPDPERDNWVFFEELTAATEYEIYTRTAETETSYASEAVKADVYTTLSCIGYDYDSELVGASITVEPEPETEGLTYKWYQDEVTEDDEGCEHHALTEIPGATGNSYTFRTEDVGKHIAVKIFAGDSEVGDVVTGGPVAATGTIVFESMGGSEIEPLTGVAYQGKVDAPADPVRQGYVFEGWYLWYYEGEYDEPWDFDKNTVMWTETTLYAKWTSVDYNITSVTGLTGSGEDQWTKGGKDSVVITVKLTGAEDDSFERFVGVKLDGKELVRDVDYTVAKGSTVVTLKPETLEKLSVGKHTVTVLFNNGQVDTTLTVLEPNAPQTGDSSLLTLWMALAALSPLAIAALLVYGKKKKTYVK